MRDVRGMCVCTSIFFQIHLFQLPSTYVWICLSSFRLFSSNSNFIIECLSICFILLSTLLFKISKLGRLTVWLARDWIHLIKLNTLNLFITKLPKLSINNLTHFNPFLFLQQGVQAILGVLKSVEEIARDTPPVDNSGSRFGNPAFRTFYDRTKEVMHITFFLCFICNSFY